MTEPRRRAFLTEPGEALVLPTSPATLAARYGEFLDATGLTEEDIVWTPLVAHPIPKLSKTAGPRGWNPNLNPAVAWHPLFWLPERVAFRYWVDEDLIENDDEWTVRVGLETSLSGLYDPVTGTWYDPLAAVGIDIDDPASQARVAAWLAGADDEMLSSIDLTEILDTEENIHWAFESVPTLIATLVPASWAYLADSLASDAGDLSLDPGDLDDAVETARVIAKLATAVLREVPADDERSQTPAELWEEIFEEMATWAGTIDELIAGPVDQLSDSLYDIRDRYWPYVEELNHELADDPA